MLSLTRSGLRRAAVAISWRGSRSRGFHACSGKAWAKFTTLGMGIHSENKFDSLLLPAVQFCAQGKVGVAAQGDLCGMWGYQFDSPIDPWHAALMAHDVAGTVDQIEHFVGVGQRDHQRGIAPYSLIGKSHPAFALPESRRNRAVGVDEGLCQKAPGRLPPNPLPHRVGNLHQIENIALLKATGEVPAGGWIRNALGAQTIEEGLIIAPQFNILQAALPPATRCRSDSTHGRSRGRASAS